jgi:hypothetical protein
MLSKLKTIGIKTFSFFGGVASAKSVLPDSMLEQIPASNNLIVDEYPQYFEDIYKKSPKECAEAIVANSETLYNSHNLLLSLEGFVIAIIIWDIKKTYDLIKEIEKSVGKEIITSRIIQDLELILDQIISCKKELSKNINDNPKINEYRINIAAKLMNLFWVHFYPLQLELAELKGQTKQRIKTSNIVTIIGLGTTLFSLITFSGFGAFTLGRQITTVGFTSALGIGVGLEYHYLQKLNENFSKINSNLELLLKLQNLTSSSNDSEKQNKKWVDDIEKILFDIKQSIKIEDSENELFKSHLNEIQIS